ncbi:MAG: hypothetical protein IJW77_09855 [Clostridia bacterium]|nr:hypothetical protein [Clostridia bacterium]
MRGGETDTHILTISDSDPDRVKVGKTYLVFFSPQIEQAAADDVYYPFSAEHTIFAPEGKSDVDYRTTRISGEWRALAGSLVLDAEAPIVTADGDAVSIAAMLGHE